MIRPNENPLFPASVAANGNQGAEAKAQSPCGAQDSAKATTAYNLARMALDAARECMDTLSLVTDAPFPGMVEAADLMDAAADSLTRAGFSDIAKASPRGAA